jgi:hypothetical protein
MDLVEPKISGASADQYAVWGGVAMEAAAAAVRNNRPREAAEYRRAASVAAAAIGHSHTYGTGPITVFGPVVAAIKSLEDAMIVGDARAVIRRSDEEEALNPKSWGRLGKPGRNSGNRHVLDLARAHVRLGDSSAAMEKLLGLHRSAPEWLVHQNSAAVTMGEIMKKRKRTLTADMRLLADHLNVSA